MTDFLLQTSWFIPFYGLIGALLTLPWAMGIVRRTGPRPAAYFNFLLTIVALIHGGIAFRTSWNREPIELAWHWLQAADLDLLFTLDISPLSLGAMELVTGLSFLAQLFALGYLERDWSLARFFALMGFFEAAISGIAISDSLFLSYGLLELLTLSTYLLVGFWYAQPLVVTAARDAFLTKRVGDVFLLMGVVALSSYGTGLSFSELERWSETAALPPLQATLLGLALIAGPIGKCAQFPLHLWLDEAMEGPNPASIMRNSVVVAAGAYILIKLQPVVTLSPVVSNVLIAIGIVTAIGGSLVAIAQIDFKRALSHSTSAFLGLVFIAVGQQAVDVALLLLFSHAVAKALQFMSVGSIIATTSNQDMREMGGLWSRMPATTIAFAVGSLGLVAFLPLGSFWTFRRWVNGFWEAPVWLPLLLIFVNLLSAINFARVFNWVFLGEPHAKTRRAPEVPWPMAVPIVSLVIVVLSLPLLLQQWQLLVTWAAPLLADGTWLNHYAMPLIAVSGGLGFWIGFQIPCPPVGDIRGKLNPLQDLLAYDFYIDRVYRVTVVALVSLGSRAVSWVDRYIVDGLVNAVGFVALISGQSLRYSASGQSQFYVVTILVGVATLLVLTFGLGDLWQELLQLLPASSGTPSL